MDDVDKVLLDAPRRQLDILRALIESRDISLTVVDICVDTERPHHQEEFNALFDALQWLASRKLVTSRDGFSWRCTSRGWLAWQRAELPSTTK